MTGVICSFTTPLKNVNVPVFAVSTWEVDEAVSALTEDGWRFRHKPEMPTDA
ncbi:hypothetical protein DFH29DRAFT_930732 [Suillus ampliporus]|nr:hypothetical protein DFH29DRAFT_930732 [Suillus ampliporus]